MQIRRIVLAVLFSLLLATGPVMAHEHRQVGDYEVVFGWRNEPAYTTLFNGPELFVTDSNGDPVVGLEETLELEVSFGPATKKLTLRAQWGEEGHYIADLIPTQAGDYSFQVTGLIGTVEVDETFTSVDGDFSSVEPITDIQFP